LIFLQSYTAANKSTWGEPSCTAIGAFEIMLFAINGFLVGLISITTWLRVCKNFEVKFGKYDYKLWAVTIFLSMIIMFSSINGLGSHKYW
jgi:hypothetical protein